MLPSRALHQISSSGKRRWFLVAGCVMAFLTLDGTEVSTAVPLRLSSTGASGGSSTSSATSTSQSATAATIATSQSAQTSLFAQRAQADMQTSIQALQAQQAAQAAAQAAANGQTSLNSSLPTVKDGIQYNGLDPGVAGTDPQNPTAASTAAGTAAGTTVSTYNLPSSWSGISGLTQTTSKTNPAVTVTVTQSASQAFLTWQTFNIGANTTLDFNQSAGGANVAQWIAINKVATGVAPSQVLGAINAPGQVYVVNQNGIIFGATSEVNAGALVAASLPLNDNLAGNPAAGVTGRGLLNNPDYQFLFSQVDIPAGTQGPTPIFDPNEEQGDQAPTTGVVAQAGVTQAGQGTLSVASASGQDGDVVVEAGAQLTSPASAENTGGKIALIGPNVLNAGAISTPDGQTILAAGLQVGFEAHDPNDPT
ncbi:MAG TPA: filamentous hemagglutinin N-terminal domain-containing protein, partial [Candidatus Methylacidiphilales bacterium]|nr:filamentous hemagglutinin N-terminal domain-containing protein [Candidatus Methylacidiphilales bacterium]